MQQCKFCKIIESKREKEEIIWEDDEFIVLTDKYRVTSVGPICLILTKEHKQNLFEIDNGERLFELIKRIGQSIQKAFKVKGIRVWTAINKEAGQSIFHFHFHIVPCNSIWDRFITILPGVYDLIKRITKFGNSQLSEKQNFEFAERLRIELKISDT